MHGQTPTEDGRDSLCLAEFPTLMAGLDYAAEGRAGLNFYSVRGELVEALPYHTLCEQAKTFARRLLGSGLTPGERVAIIAETEGDFLRLFFGCQYARLIPVPLPLPAAFGGRGAYVAHLKGMIETCGARAAFGPDALLPMLHEATSGMELALCGTIASLADQPVFTGDLPAPQADDLSYIQFSSGSTRFPLGIAVTHRALIANCHAIAKFGLKLHAGDRCASWLPFFHDMGLVGFMLTPVLTQISVDYLATRDFARRPLLWLQLISQNKASLSYSPSFGYELCARRAQTAPPAGLDLRSWRVAGIGGDMVRARVLERFAEIFAASGFRPTAFVPSYGLAEATLAISFAPLEGGFETDRIDMDRFESEKIAVAPAPASGLPTMRTREFVLCGAVLPGHQVEIRDSHGNNLPERHAGAVFIRGPSLMKGYYGRPAETQRVLTDDGWLDTGDIGYFVGSSLVITGRRKDLILVNGRNIVPQDLEWAIEQEVSGLRSGDVAAFSIDDGEQEQIVILAEGRERDPAARACLKRAIGGVVRTRTGIAPRVFLVPPHSLPHTSSGKLSRNKAREMLLGGSFGPLEDEIRDADAPALTPELQT